MIQTLATNARVVAALGRRSVMQTLRRPQLAAPLLIFPTALLAIQTAGAGRAVDLPGFPHVPNFLSFMLAGAIVQSVMMTGNSGAIAFAIDMEMGFTDRLYAAPISRFSVVLGRLIATATLGAIIAVYFIVLGLIFGASIHEGVPAAIWIVPEADRHRRKRRGADELAFRAAQTLAFIVEYLDLHAERCALDFAAPHGQQ